MPGLETGAGSQRDIQTSRENCSIGRASDCKSERAGSIPAFRSKSPDEGTGSPNQPREWFETKGSGFAPRGVARVFGKPEGKGRRSLWPRAGRDVTHARLFPPGSAAQGRTPRTRRRASPPFSARGHGRTGFGPIHSSNGQSCPLPTPVTGLIPCNPNPKGDRALRRQ